MTNDELRQLCVDYMILQSSIVWTPTQDFHYECSYAGSADSLGNLNFKRGTRYAGLPYSSAARDLPTFLELYDEETGLLNISSLGTNVGAVVGNNCGTAVFWGWSRVSGSISYSGTISMVQANGCLKLGPYEYDLTQTDYKTVGTDQICKTNGEQKMYESYAMLRKADGLVMYNGGTTGHTRMLKEAAIVVRNADGTINGDQSKVICIEQYSTQTSQQTEDGKVQFIGGLEKEYTFKKLYDTYYLPFEIAELAGKAEVQKAAASLNLEKDTVTVDELSAAAVDANYAISKVTVRFTDAAGGLAYEKSAYGSAGRLGEQKTMAINRVVSTVNATRNLKKGTTYQVEVLVRLGNGETISAYTGSLTA